MADIRKPPTLKSAEERELIRNAAEMRKSIDSIQAKFKELEARIKKLEEK